jgi:hypothetical protein
MQAASWTPDFLPAHNCLTSALHAFATVAALDTAFWQVSERSAKCDLMQSPMRPPPGCTLPHTLLRSATQAFAIALVSGRCWATAAEPQNSRRAVPIVSMVLAMFPSRVRTQLHSGPDMPPVQMASATTDRPNVVSASACQIIIFTTEWPPCIDPAQLATALTPMSYAGVARRTTRRAVAVGTPGAAGHGAYGYTGSGCTQALDAYGRIYAQCP